MSKATSGADQVEAAGTGEDSGRFAIDAERRAATVVPPTTPEAEELSLDALIEVAPAASKPVTVPPPVPAHARSHASGLAPARSQAPVAAAPAAEPEDEAPMDSLRPFYKDLGEPRERAEVDIADLSLQLDNPYLASSLVPPAQDPPAFGRMLVGAAAVIAMLAGGYFAFGRVAATPATPPVAAAARTEHATERAAAPVEPAPSITAQKSARVVEAVPAAAAAQAQPVAAKLPAPEIAAPVEAPVAPRATAPVESPAAVAADPKPAEPATPSTAVAPAATAPAATAAAAAAAPASAAAPAPSDLPATPTREQVAAGFDALRPDLLQCAAGKPGVVIIDATLAGAGRVAYALVDGTVFKGTPEGSCMARAIRKARFPQFAQDTLKVRYPVQL